MNELPTEICHFNKTCTGVSLNDNGATATFEDGTSSSADLIIGADGVRSVVRRTLFGDGDLRWTGHQCYRALVPTGGVVDYVNPDSTFSMGPNAHVVTYYVKGGEMVNIVAVTDAKEWVAESWSTKASRDEMLADYEGWHKSLEELFSHVDEVYNWGLFDRDPLASWTRGFVTLLGDACHPMLPFLSQGAAMAIEDGFVLGEALSLYPDNLTDALAAYEAERRPRTARVRLRLVSGGAPTTCLQSKQWRHAMPNMRVGKRRTRARPGSTPIGCMTTTPVPLQRGTPFWPTA